MFWKQHSQAKAQLQQGKDLLHKADAQLSANPQHAYDLYNQAIVCFTQSAAQWGIDAPGEVFFYTGLCCYQMAQVSALIGHSGDLHFQNARHYFNIALQKEPHNREFLKAAAAVGMQVEDGAGQLPPGRKIARKGRCPHCGEVELTKQLSHDTAFILSHRFYPPKEIFECTNCGELLFPCRICNKRLIPLKVNPHTFGSHTPAFLSKYKAEEGRCVDCINKQSAFHR